LLKVPCLVIVFRSIVMSQTSAVGTDITALVDGLQKPSMPTLKLISPNRLEVQDVPVPSAKSGEVVVAVMSASVCGSDLVGQAMLNGRRGSDLTMGHENAGILVALADDYVGPLQIGSRIVMDSSVYCGKSDCPACSSGRTNCCPHVEVLGVKCAEFTRQGGYAKYIAVPSHICHKLPDGLSFNQGCLFEPLAVAQHGVNRAKRNLKKGDFALVCGIGMIGRFVIDLLRKEEVNVIAFNRSTRRLDYPRKLGIPSVCFQEGENWQDDLDRAVKDVFHFTDGKGVSTAFEVAGYEETSEIALRCLSVGGQFIIIGDQGKRYPLWTQRIAKAELDVYGVKAFPASCIPQAMQAIADGSVDLSDVIDWTGGLQKAVGLFADFEGIRKAVINPWA
jgi:L-iditol 2-dehydrogenase